MVLGVPSGAEDRHAGPHEVKLAETLDELGRRPEDPPQLQRPVARPGEKPLLRRGWRALAPILVRAFGRASDRLGTHLLKGV